MRLEAVVVGDVVVGDIATVPPEYHIAEAETAFCYREELVLAHELAAQHTVNVGHGHFHLEVFGVADVVEDLFGGEVGVFHGREKVLVDTTYE